MQCNVVAFMKRVMPPHTSSPLHVPPASWVVTTKAGRLPDQHPGFRLSFAVQSQPGIPLSHAKAWKFARVVFIIWLSG